MTSDGGERGIKDGNRGESVEDIIIIIIIRGIIMMMMRREKR